MPVKKLAGPATGVKSFDLVSGQDFNVQFDAWKASVGDIEIIERDEMKGALGQTVIVLYWRHAPPPVAPKGFGRSVGVVATRSRR